jgi:asparagine synthase (glutamine-hydrolysing)
MLRSMVHRGPDSEGILEAPNLAAGVRRLRVIDLATGDQPIGNEDGTVEVVFNGEIYNYRELRRGLESRGHRFRTATDTEVLVHLWEDENSAMFARLNGMFAFCLLDRRRGEAWIVRDPLGVKPLFYGRKGSHLYFASEARALLAAIPSEMGIDPASLVDAFRLQYLPGEATFWGGARKLLPGHALRVSRGVVEVRRWHSFEDGAESAGHEASRATGELASLLERAVVDQTVADVPVGAFLSGGLDSTIVVHLLSRMKDRPVSTFSVGFENHTGGDETHFARLVARRYGTAHHELAVSAADVAVHLPALVERLGSPVLDPAMIPTFLLSARAREDVTVVLTGEGSDEIFGGYRRYVLQDRFGGIPGAGLARRLTEIPALARLLPRRAPQALEALFEKDPARNHVLWTSTVDGATGQRLFGKGLWAERERDLVGHFQDYFAGKPNEVDTRLRADLCEWLPHNLLSKIDHATMACSLEARVPYLDLRVVAWALRLPPRMKVRSGVGKHVLRAAFRDVVPREILERPKRGFDLPLGEWLRGPLRSLATETMARENLRRWELLDADAAEGMLDAHLSGRGEFGLPLFLLTSILLFLQRGDPT